MLLSENRRRRDRRAGASGARYPAAGRRSGRALQALIIDSGSITTSAWCRWCGLKRHHAQGRQDQGHEHRPVYNADRLGIFTPKQVDRTELKCGEVGWLVCAIKDILGAPVGDTLTAARNPADKALRL